MESLRDIKGGMTIAQQSVKWTFNVQETTLLEYL